MSERKFTTRPPLRDLDLAFNPRQPRDNRGRWVKTGVSEATRVASEVAHNAYLVPQPKAPAKSLAAKANLHGHEALSHAEKKAISRVRLKKVKGRLVKKEAIEPEPRDLRHLRKLSADARMAIYHEAGLKLQFPDKSDDDLLAEFHKSGHTQAERDAIHEELRIRQERLKVVTAAVEQSMRDYAREGKRDAFRKFTQNLTKLPGGKAILAMRERLLKDKWLDRQEVLQEWLHHHGKHYAGHVVTVVAIASVLHPLGLATIGGLGAAGLLNVPGADEAFSAMMDSIWIHSGLATALAPISDKLTGPLFDWLGRERKVERAKRYAAKHPPTRLTV